jgi:hypothetical protein
MDEHLFLKGQRVITPEGEGEVTDAVGDQIQVKLDNGTVAASRLTSYRITAALINIDIILIYDAGDQ